MSTALIKACPRCGADVSIGRSETVACGACGAKLRTVVRPPADDPERPVAAVILKKPSDPDSSRTPRHNWDSCYPGWLGDVEARRTRRPFLVEEDGSGNAVRCLRESNHPLPGEFELQDTFWESLAGGRRTGASGAEPAATEPKKRSWPAWLPVLIPLGLLALAAAVIVMHVLRG